MAEISYPADWRDIPADRWAKMVMAPERLYLLDADGQVVFKTVAGSHGFDPEAWATATAGHLEQ